MYAMLKQNGLMITLDENIGIEFLDFKHTSVSAVTVDDIIQDSINTDSDGESVNLNSNSNTS